MSETHIVARVAKTIADEFGDKRVSRKHQKAAYEAVLAIADALGDLGDECADEDTGVNLRAVSGYLIEVAHDGAPKLTKREFRRLMSDIDEMTGPGGEVYGHRD